MSQPEVLQIGGATDEMRARLDAEFKVHVMSEIDDFDAWAAEHGAGVEAVMTNGHDGVPAKVMEALPNLKVVSGYGVGYDAVDTDACVARGIKVSHTPDVLNGEVANTALLLLLAGLRNFRHDEAWARSGDWETSGNAPLSTSPDGKTIGILGLGRIGQEIADRMAIFNPTIVYHTRSKKDVPYTYYGDLVEMAAACDVLICITPGGPSTNKIVNKQVLEALGPSGMLINVSRGSVVDEAALIEALDSGKLGLAGLDVFEKEPHIPDALKTSDRTVLLPHVGSGTHETRAAMGKLTVDNLLQWKADGTVKTPVPECAHL
ncbi:lactate dehydrogenase-like 2-hydroxyacid dehydrogenase [Litoreibacter ponti]|uniref:Lactate dehydrogenase-like 2-hydroxyacid dehydrogenase n=1 Tax=Litoreibacter ponti TaxID=1510457 RepID=A0A2T6BDY0_9RHOB|nr:2-hydroxyacid dehydrogenase [Litoreibacter ponti]PTX54234.1 lactate dehydrogenase-like 2-hydroxyacid dehydrogenase [Litoreibacter ponti]